jgi:subtilisin family serine protease
MNHHRMSVLESPGSILAAILVLLVLPPAAKSAPATPANPRPSAALAPAVSPAIVHPLLRPWIESGDATSIPASIRGHDRSLLLTEIPRMGLWVRAKDGGRSLEAAGLLPAGRPAPVRRARWTRDDLLAALRDPNLVRLAPAVPCRTSLDSSLVETLTTNTHDRSGTPPVYAGLTGARVVVGIVDTGIDLYHGDFRDASNQTRIAYLWDQTLSGTPPPGYTYGREWSAAQINAGLAIENDTSGHGTHVLGIAAGDGSGTGNGKPPFRYVGMAPDAVIIAVKSDLYSDKIADGVNYIFGRAEQMGLPAVVDLSLGNQFGPHDGTDDFDVTMDLLSGPGHIVVAAAGNDRGDAVHAEAIVAPADSATITFTIPGYTPQPLNNNDEVVMDAWYTGGTNLSIQVISPNGAVVGPVAKGASVASSTPDGRVEIDNATWVPGNGAENASIRLIDAVALLAPRQGTWTIRIDSLDPATGKAPPEFDIWAWYASMGNVRFVRRVQEEEIVSSPASADSVIAVAAYMTKTRWPSIDGNTYRYDPEPVRGDIADFSSIGPRRDGVLKPDIAAPGMAIISALSTAAPYDARVVAPDGVHWVLQGTSMAAPHVAGLAALMDQAWGPISALEMRQRIAAAARADAHTGSVPNTTWGYGKINSLAATAYPVPVEAIESTAVQDGDFVRVSFLLPEAVGTAPLSIWRSGPDDGERAMIGWSSEGRERAFTDSTLTASGSYGYWLRAQDGASATWIGPAVILFRPSHTAGIDAAPNPFTNRSWIRWRLPLRDAVRSLSVHDLSGRRVRSFATSGAERRSGVVVWDGTDAEGNQTPAGIYWISLRTEDGANVTRKILRLK